MKNIINLLFVSLTFVACDGQPLRVPAITSTAVGPAPLQTNPSPSKENDSGASSIPDNTKANSCPSRPGQCTAMSWIDNVWYQTGDLKPGDKNVPLLQISVSAGCELIMSELGFRIFARDHKSNDQRPFFFSGAWAFENGRLRDDRTGTVLEMLGSPTEAEQGNSEWLRFADTFHLDPSEQKIYTLFVDVSDVFVFEDGATQYSSGFYSITQCGWGDPSGVISSGPMTIFNASPIPIFSVLSS